MNAFCPSCGKPKAATAGSITSYFFQEKYCRCEDTGKSVSSRRPTIIESNKRICLNCGKSSPKDQKAGSFTAYLFLELRCQCLAPKFKDTDIESEQSHSGTAERANHRQTLAKDYKAQTKTKTIGPGTVIGGTFRIESTIGEGGMGTVYLAQHLSMQQNYALKILLPTMVSEKNLVRFQAEARTLATLNHPSLVNVYDLGTHEQSVFYYSMDYLHGRNLENLLAAEGPQSLEHTIEIFLQVLDGLAYAHNHNIVHRDIKPANIFLCQSGATGGAAVVKILDFGIAKLVALDNAQRLTAVGEIFGSPFYMSPEQCRGDEVDERSDVYAVGCAIFECLTGYVPFEGQSSVEIAMMHQEQQVPLLASLSKKDFPVSMDAVLGKCLAKVPSQRYQSAGELAVDLRRVRDGKELVHASRNRSEDDDPDDVREDENEEKRNRAPLIAAIAIVLIALGSIPAWFYFANETESTNTTPQKIEQPVITKMPVVSSETYGDRPEDYPVKPFLESNPAEYSQTIIVGGQKIKRFSFPRFSIGDLTVWKDGVKTETLTAQGDCNVPIGHVVRLEANKFVNNHPQLLRYFKSDDLHAINFLDDKTSAATALPYIAKLASLQSLTLMVNTFTVNDVAYLNQLKKLQDLNLTVSGGGASSLAKLERLPNLFGLTLNCPGSISAVFAQLAGNNNLVHLALTRVKLKGKDIEQIASCKNLKSLLLKNCPGLDSTCLASLKKFKKLERLVLPVGVLSPAQDQELARALPRVVR